MHQVEFVVKNFDQNNPNRTTGTHVTERTCSSHPNRFLMNSALKCAAISEALYCLRKKSVCQALLQTFLQAESVFRRGRGPGNRLAADALASARERTPAARAKHDRCDQRSPELSLVFERPVNALGHLA